MSIRKIYCDLNVPFENIYFYLLFSSDCALGMYDIKLIEEKVTRIINELSDGFGYGQYSDLFVSHSYQDIHFELHGFHHSVPFFLILTPTEIKLTDLVVTLRSEVAVARVVCLGTENAFYFKSWVIFSSLPSTHPFETCRFQSLCKASPVHAKTISMLFGNRE